MRKTWEEFRLLYRYAERKKDLVYSFWCPKWAFWICSMILNLKASLLKKAFGKTLHKLVSMLEKNGIEGSDRWQMKGWVLWVGFSGNRCWDGVLGKMFLGISTCEKGGSSIGQKEKLMRLWWDSTKPQLTQRETLALFCNLLNCSGLYTPPHLGFPWEGHDLGWDAFLWLKEILKEL